MNADELSGFASELAESHSRMLKVGIEVAEKRFYASIRGLDAAYRLALLDPDTMIPSPLGACIVAMISLLPEAGADVGRYLSHDSAPDLPAMRKAGS